MQYIQGYSEKHGNHLISVDDRDYEHLSFVKWYIVKPCNKFYAVGRIDGKMKKMHRVILGLEDPRIFVDHRDHDGLNNQRHNIRIASYSQNMANRRSQINSSSKYLGVYWAPKNRKWKAQVRDKGKLVYLGYYANEIDAAKAYNSAALKAHGEFANLNNI